MNKTIRTAVLTSVVALSGAFSTVAQADGYRNEGGASASQYQGQDQQQQQQQQQGQNQGQSQTANGGTAISGSNSASNSTAVSGSTSGAVAQTGPINVDAAGGQGGQGGQGGTAVSNAQGGTSVSNAQGGSTGPISVAPSQSTVNNFRSFVGTNAPNLSGSVDNCLAVLGWSAAVNVFGSTGVGIGGGNQRAEYIEQCAAVKSAFEVWNRANGDLSKEAFAIEMLIKALPNYAAPAMEKAVERINTYIEQNGDQEPDSVMSIFGARAFRKGAAAAPAAPANNNSGTTININPVVHTIEKTREVRTVVQPAKPAAPKAAPKPAAPKPAPKAEQKPCKCTP